jgi:hypothetical protein
MDNVVYTIDDLNEEPCKNPSIEDKIINLTPSKRESLQQTPSSGVIDTPKSETEI